VIFTEQGENTLTFQRAVRFWTAAAGGSRRTPVKA